ncbi:MAG: nucleoside deaminase [archaeon]
MDYMKEAVKEAFSGMRKGDGGPFGAVIVKNNKIITRAHNTVLKTNDPSAHAEVNAIRKATKKLKRFDLSDCEIYTACEPCPMCFAAIHWAKMKKMYYVCTRKDAGKIGFDDKVIYEAMKTAPQSKTLKAIHVESEEALKAFDEWKNKKNKKMY